MGKNEAIVSFYSDLVVVQINHLPLVCPSSPLSLSLSSYSEESNISLLLLTGGELVRRGGRCQCGAAHVRLQGLEESTRASQEIHRSNGRHQQPEGLTHAYIQTIHFSFIPNYPLSLKLVNFLTHYIRSEWICFTDVLGHTCQRHSSCGRKKHHKRLALSRATET